MTLRKFTKMIHKHAVLLACVLIGIILLNQLVGSCKREGLTMLSNEASVPSSDNSGNEKELVYFYMPGCGHCKRFSPTWTDFETQNNTSIKTRKINSEKTNEEEQLLLKKMQIKGFPTVMLIDVKTQEKIVTYEGDRTVEGLTNFCEQYN